jgi:hypothetical protein
MIFPCFFLEVTKASHNKQTTFLVKYVSLSIFRRNEAPNFGGGGGGGRGGCDDDDVNINGASESIRQV